VGLGDPAQGGKGGVGGDAVAAHEDAHGLADEAVRVDGTLEVLGPVLRSVIEACSVAIS
jgi:hypothetical protein